MREVDISNAMGQHLVNAGLGFPIVWENRDATPRAPYLTYEYVPTRRRELSLSGGAPVSEGYVQITVVSESGEYATAAWGIADDILDAFMPMSRLQITGADIVMGAGRAIPGYPDGVHYRIAVRIPYAAYSQT